MPLRSNNSTINRTWLITQISRRHPELSTRDINDAVRLIIDRMTQTLVDHGRIELRNFGTFSLRRRRARMARNPRTGKSVVVGTRHIPHFKPGKHLRQRLANLYQ